MAFRLVSGTHVAGTIAAHTPIEVVCSRSRYSAQLVGLDELEEIVRSVAVNGLTETLWCRKNIVIRSSASLLLQDRRITIRNRAVLTWWWRAATRTITYLPYV